MSRPVSNKDGVVVANTLLSRKVEFHLARKPVSSFSATCSNFKIETLNPSSSSMSQPVPPKPSNNKPTDSFDFLDAELSFHIPFRRIGAGLENLGNTCFLNSVIQCLTYTEPLVAYLQSGKHQTTCRIAGFCALCAIQKHVSRALQSTGRILTPKDLVSNLRCISRNFRNSRQEDAHEYMIHLLESMHKCCLPSGLLAESPGAYDKSLVHRIFGGSLRSQVKCLQCSYCSNTFDPFLDLSLEIVKADSLNKALMHFTAAEQLDGGERQYKCERCKQKVRALKQLTVYKAPYVLTIHLKRFRSHFSGQKIDKKVQFGSTLDLKPFVSGAYEGDLKYTLYGVLVHAGWSTHSGHYYCFVRTSSGLWYSLDDCRVTQVSEKTVLEQKAYMLFYVRDRKNFTHKKAMDVIQKENLISTIRNASGSCSIPGAKSTQNGTLEKNSREAILSGVFVKDAGRINTSGAAAQQNTSKMSTSNNTLMKQDMNQKPNCTVSSGTSNVKREDSLLSESDLDGGVLAKTKCKNASHVRNAKNSEPTTNCGVFNNSQSDIPVSAAKLCVNDSCSNVATDRSNKASDMVITTADTKVHDAQPSIKNGCEPDKTGLLAQPTSESRSKEGAVEVTSGTHSISRNSRKLRSSNGSLPQKPVRCAQRRTLMKKMFKPRVLGFHLSTKMLYGASLCLRKMRKGKRVKASKEKVLQKHLLKEDCVSEETCALTSAALREEEHNDAKKCAKNLYHKSPTISSDGVLNDRLTCSKTVLATGKPPEESACTSLETIKANIGDSKQLSSDLQTGVTNAHTRELGEVTVARWEGIESPSEIMESKGQDSLSIGYVLDDWDEEYDRGKRKKVRGLRTNFDGSNPFQVIAAKKAKTNAKTGQYNQPFRI